MSKKCWLAIAVVFALALALVVALPVLLPPTPGVTYANFSRLEVGMTRSEVESLLGQPQPHIDEFPLFRELIQIEMPGKWKGWQNDAGDFVEVRFGENDQVTEVSWNGWRDERSGWEKFRDRLPWIGKKPPAMVIIID